MLPIGNILEFDGDKSVLGGLGDGNLVQAGPVMSVIFLGRLAMAECLC